MRPCADAPLPRTSLRAASCSGPATVVLTHVHAGFCSGGAGLQCWTNSGSGWKTCGHLLS